MTIPRNDEIFHGDMCKVQDHIDTLLIECQCHDKSVNKMLQECSEKNSLGKIKKGSTEEVTFQLHHEIYAMDSW